MQDRQLYQQILGIGSPWLVSRVELDLEAEEVHVRVVQIPWAEPYGRFTALFERLVLDWLQAASQQAVADRVGLSWDEVHGIMERAVKRGLARREAEPIPHIGVDEKSLRKRHRYVTAVSDIDRGRVLYVAETSTPYSSRTIS